MPIHTAFNKITAMVALTAAQSLQSFLVLNFPSPALAARAALTALAL